eukprot:TRINITY_DN12317_c0_g1_i1.p1 TRINITY_DN12317_c0_g1~~TRINITY_DN12317_c0_g1_i1.p1  ORF type:complete len:234 (+),score=26.59 TRINITY_DN12317_c0_g1_i1:387-1088(+)
MYCDPVTRNHLWYCSKQSYAIFSLKTTYLKGSPRCLDAESIVKFRHVCALELSGRYLNEMNIGYFLGSDPFVNRLASLTHLTKLVLVRWPMLTGETINFHLFNKLVHLDLSGTESLSDRGMINICSNLTNLTYLDISDCTGLSHSAFTLLPKLNNLKYLGFHGVQKSDEVIHAISEISTLRTLILSSTLGLSQAGIDIISSMTNLEHLEFSGSPIAYHHDFENLSYLQCLQFS